MSRTKPRESLRERLERNVRERERKLKKLKDANAPEDKLYPARLELSYARDALEDWKICKAG